MNPGESVASPRSMTWAPCGIVRLLPASMILSPWTMTTPFVTSAFDLPSNRRAAFRARTGPELSAAKAKETDDRSTAQASRTRRDLASDERIGWQYEMGGWKARRHAA